MEGPASNQQPLVDVTNPLKASEALKAGEARMMSAKPVVAEKALAAHEAADDEGRRVAEAPSSADGCQKRSDGEEKEAPAVAAPEQPPVAKKPKRAPIEEAPKPLTKELPEALMEWKEYAENELKQLHVYRKQQLLDWPLVKGAINCAVVSCPVAALRAEIRALRDNGVYGSSMVPYLQVLRAIFDTTEDYVDQVDEEPEEFSESDDNSSSDEEDSDESEDESESESESELEEEEEEEAVDANKKARARGGGGGGVGEGGAGGGGGGGSHGRGASEVPMPAAAAARVKKGMSSGKPKGSSRGGAGGGGSDGPSQYQIEMRKRYNAFTRFLGGYFATERKEEASIGELLSHREAAQFSNDEVVSFLDMMTRENKAPRLGRWGRGARGEKRGNISHMGGHDRQPNVRSGVAGVRNAYAAHAQGATGYYAESGHAYVNPHDRGVHEMLVRAVREWPEIWAPPPPPPPRETAESAVKESEGEGEEEQDEGRILDLSCGSGEVTAALVAAGVSIDRIDACDPYTGDAYLRRIGRPAEKWSFEDFARGDLSDRRWRVVLCSFAMHLCDRAYLPTLCMMLAYSTDNLVVLTPHKRPELDPAWGWHLWSETRDPYWRIRLRRYGVDFPPEPPTLLAAADDEEEDEED